jgi:phenylacetate-CoA ligase
MNNYFNKKMETLPGREIKNLQLKQLKKTVHHVYDNVTFYKKKFKELNIKPDDIKTLADITKASVHY